MRLADLSDARIAVWGFGREGRAALAVLRARFPTKPVTLFCSEDEAAHVGADSLLTVNTHVDAQALAAFDIVVKSPGISPYRSPTPEAAQAGVRFVSGTMLWFAEHPRARTIAVTGTKGKSTVTALIAHLLRRSGRRVALAGNIGLPLLELLAPSREPDWWVIELSSFQTRDLQPPQVAADAVAVGVINNLYEEHLDWHGSRERYAADKLALGDVCRSLVMNGAQAALITRVRGQRDLVEFGVAPGWHLEGDAICRGAKAVLRLAEVPLPGAHNALNVCAALAAVETALAQAGEPFDARAFAEHVRSFKALPHRLQDLGERDGIRYVNDSISTTPYATIEALRSLRGPPLTVLVGGFDRGVDWKAFMDYVHEHPPHAVIAMGANGAAIATALRRLRDARFSLDEAATLDAALAQARARTPAGGVVVLSPGAPSFDQFRDYAERGRAFARLAGFDPDRIAQIEGLGIA